MESFSTERHRNTVTPHSSKNVGNWPRCLCHCELHFLTRRVWCSVTFYIIVAFTRKSVAREACTLQLNQLVDAWLSVCLASSLYRDVCVRERTMFHTCQFPFHPFGLAGMHAESAALRALTVSCFLTASGAAALVVLLVSEERERSLRGW